MSPISAYYQNVRGLRTKTSLFYRNVCINSYDIICLTETWLIEDIKDCELFDDRYIAFRRDRDYARANQSMGGGVLIAVRRELACDIRCEWFSSAEDLWISLYFNNKNVNLSFKVHVCVVYICNQNYGNSQSVRLYNFSKNLFDIVSASSLDRFLVPGDFNLPNIEWKPSDDGISLSPDNIQAAAAAPAARTAARAAPAPRSTATRTTSTSSSVRPLNDKERAVREREVLEFPGKGQVICAAPGQKPKVFSYNVVFEPAATQEDVLEYSGVKRLLEMAVEGFSATVLCYGQTGSGKTHTLTGPPGLVESGASPYSEEHGLVVRSFVHLFRLMRDRPDYDFVLKASFLEIYNEKVIDLLNPGSARKPLQVRWSKQTRSFYVENLFTVDCEQLDDLFAVLEEGMRNRAVGSHAMNATSSRSHSVLSVRVTRAPSGGGPATRGKIHFVDLAGSEITKRTHSTGKTLEEANNINRSLMVLGYCIAQLSDGRKKGHIPYRDSKLTKLLADSLAGNGVTLMIACIAPSKSNITETINTLRYAARTKKIKSKPVVKMDARDALILSLKREVEALQAENQHLRAALVTADYNTDGRQLSSPVDSDKLYTLPRGELVQLTRLHMAEEAALRRENAELFAMRDQLLRDHQMVSRENERLLKKLEDVNSVCVRSPIIPARPAYSDANVEQNVWTNVISATNSVTSDKN